VCLESKQNKFEILRPPSSTIERSLAVTGLAASAGVLFLIKTINPTSSGWFPQCPFYALTGLSCPGCGATRGMHQLLNGDVLAALDYNALLVLFVPIIIYFLLNLVWVALRGRTLGIGKLPTAGIWAFAVVLLVFGVLRNLPFYPFTILAP
jgi:TM2 domain-containing membrane protein YozV